MKLTPRLAAPALLALLALTAACGSSPSSSAQVASLGSSETTADSAAGTTAPANMEDAMLAFAQCMRDHGIDMPDPEFKDDGGGFTVGLPEGKDNQDKTKLDEAQKGCQPILANAQGNVDIDPQKQAEMEQKLLEYAQCMRDHGIDMADPQIDANGGVLISVGGPDGSAPTGSDAAPPPGEGGPKEDPKFAEADEACNKDLPKPGPDGTVVESEG